MKIVNENIKVLASFKADGTIIPLRFKREDDKTIQIDKIVKTHDEMLAGNHRIVFTCMQNEKDLYEIKYEVDTQKWYLFKI